MLIPFAAYSVNGEFFNAVLNNADNEIEFQANTDRVSKVTNQLPNKVIARYIRLLPLTWHDRISLRWELLGCRKLIYTQTVNYSKCSSSIVIIREYINILSV